MASTGGGGPVGLAWPAARAARWGGGRSAPFRKASPCRAPRRLHAFLPACETGSAVSPVATRRPACAFPVVVRRPWGVPAVDAVEYLIEANGVPARRAPIEPTRTGCCEGIDDESADGRRTAGARRWVKFVQLTAVDRSVPTFSRVWREGGERSCGTRMWTSAKKGCPYPHRRRNYMNLRGDL